MPYPTILLAAGDAALRQDLRRRLLSQPFQLIEAGDRSAAFEAVRDFSPDLAILGSWSHGDGEVIQAARDIHACNRDVLLILIVSQSTEDIAFAALRAGINDYVKSPFSFEELLARINHCLAGRSCPAPPPKSKSPDCEADACGALIGDSAAMRLVKSYILRAAVTDSTVLITGESGTGKELAAELIHRSSLRREKPLVCVNCAALPDSLLESELFGYERGAFTGASAPQRGKFEQANGGTVLLDEIGDMDLHAQAKILRAIESKEICRLGGHKSTPLNVRFIAATNQDLERLLTEKRFRLDLYYRLNVARVHLPPLRERKDDILELFNHYIRELNQRFGRSVVGFADEALEYLMRYDWPGNVRELKNLCEAIFINLPARKISFLDLPDLYQKRLKEVEALPQSERERLLSALFTTNWNVSKAARKLNWSRITVYRKLEKYHIRKPLRAEAAEEQDYGRPV
ncbi:MAG TPA: sigma-54 dependent transcriptional regulator [Pyrinomonadaceae bacterium]|jgi:DNA-binding NtrC family response regulator|nr:sigma-54 dependent transcriptional regulator [Pyrinomonadaceae bacterium]